MTIWLIIGANVVVLYHRMSVLYTSLDKLVLDLILVQECRDSRVAVSSLDQNMGQLVEKSKLLEKTLNVHHDKSKLLITINNVKLSTVISKEVHLSVCILSLIHI